METSINKTTVPALLKTGGFSFQTEPRQCVIHGEFLSMKTPAGWSECHSCSKDARREEVRRAEAKAAHESQMHKAQIPVRFIGRTLHNFDAHNDGAARALRIAQSYAGDFARARGAGQALVFCGDVGTGKTHLAIGIVHQVMAQRYTARYAVLMDSICSVKQTWGKGSTTTEAAIIESLTSPDLLVLDEVGIQYGSETEKMILFAIINGRYNQMKPTIIISNLAREPLTEYLGDRVADRLREGGGRMVVFDWESHRGTVA